MRDNGLDHLQHYASPYYDPEKAHEYYERTKELKGRRSTSKLNDEGKIAWTYTKDQIKEQKKREIEAETERKQATIAQHREQAKQSRERISQRLKALSDYLKSIEVPKGSSKEERARITEDKKAQRAQASAEAAAERESISAELKSVCEAARESYKKAKEDINANYEEIFQEEFDKIASEYAAKSKKGSKQRDPRVENALRNRGLLT